jgi:putative photosynthetic complex assembly protein
MPDSALRRPSGGMPRGVLTCAGVLIAFSIVSAGVGRLSGLGAVHYPAANAVRSLALRFEDQANGSVLVRDAKDGAVIYTIAPGSNGFMRATLRGLAQERKRSDVGDEVPFRLVRWDDGRMTLDDTTTGRRVALEAFGATNAQAFAQLFSARGGPR